MNSRGILWPQMGELGLHGITVERNMAGLASAISSMSSRRRRSRGLGLGRLRYGAHSNLCVNQIRRWVNE